ncbi:MAG: endonuclease III [Armatimonadetes bacterium]|nr:endonuclease III [Armatimonadota bacterium]
MGMRGREGEAAGASLEEVQEVHAILLRTYDVDKTEMYDDPPLDSLVRTILSQNTNDRNRDKAFARLKEQWGLWDEVADAPYEAVAEAIRSSNHAPTKAGRIQAILRQLREEQGGRATLDFLREMSTEDASAYLLSMEGVGKKTAACVLMFSLDRPVMPVDTHIHRVAQRLAWIGPKVGKDAAHDLLAEIVPPEMRAKLHINFWEHGRVVCRPIPKCAMCTIYRYCRYDAKTAPEPTEEEARERLQEVKDVQLAF